MNRQDTSPELPSVDQHMQAAMHAEMEYGLLAIEINEMPGLRLVHSWPNFPEWLEAGPIDYMLTHQANVAVLVEGPSGSGKESARTTMSKAVAESQVVRKYAALMGKQVKVVTVQASDSAISLRQRPLFDKATGRRIFYADGRPAMALDPTKKPGFFNERGFIRLWSDVGDRVGKALDEREEGVLRFVNVEFAGGPPVFEDEEGKTPEMGWDSANVPLVMRPNTYIVAMKPRQPQLMKAIVVRRALEEIIDRVIKGDLPMEQGNKEAEKMFSGFNIRMNHTITNVVLEGQKWGGSKGIVLSNAWFDRWINHEARSGNIRYPSGLRWEDLKGMRALFEKDDDARVEGLGEVYQLGFRDRLGLSGERFWDIDNLEVTVEEGEEQIDLYRGLSEETAVLVDKESPYYDEPSPDDERLAA